MNTGSDNLDSTHLSRLGELKFQQDAHVTSSVRSRNMAAIRGKDTKPEMIVRNYLWRNGFRYRLNHPRLPGKPDVVLRRFRTCIFVNGCFWHGHDGCSLYSIPKTNREFWVNKVRRNKERDVEVQRKLASMGWHTIVVWECDLKPSKRDITLESLAFTLNHIFILDSSSRGYAYQPVPDSSLVAEETCDYGNG